MVPFNGAWTRVRQLTSLKNQADLATALQISPASVSGAKKRGFFPLEWLLKLALDHRVSLDSLVGLDYRQANGRDNFSTSAADSKNSRQSFVSPYAVDNKETRSATPHQTAAYMGQQILAESNLEASAAKTHLVDDDSMEPTIFRNDLLVVDRHCARIEGGGIYLLNVLGHQTVRRVEVMLNQEVRISADNPAYHSQCYNINEIADDVVVGKVLWRGHRI
ncbi:LexA family transcriptional regulator [Desulfurispira natronophila]|uniref:Phage repressor protein C with HTH and peptisase S24 domain n=1 Tax=Desulfurispira natronophila TaxID=682562 RepID=A0A7W7Y2E7_9BACT|nr:LexA family transcriptional regulator [Desulfurispira natronophila]MBB5020779.1 phage repressor protein C with HTH and peptisase S24 domain [Desulfurispira natronophila]